MSKWKESLSLTIYELAKTGLKNTEIAKCLGVNSATFNNWRARKKLCRTALKKGRNIYQTDSNSPNNFLDYVHRRLPKKLNKLWDQIMALDEKKSGVERVEALLAKHGTRTRQNLFIHALVSSNFKKAVALRRTGTSYTTLKGWMENDPDFPDMVDFIRELRGDFFEDALSKSIKLGDTSSIIFANRTFNRNRGYNERVDLNVDGNVVHEHTLRVGEMDLSYETQKEILESMRWTKYVKNQTVGEEQKSLPIPSPISISKEMKCVKRKPIKK